MFDLSIDILDDMSHISMISHICHWRSSWLHGSRNVAKLVWIITNSQQSIKFQKKN